LHGSLFAGALVVASLGHAQAQRPDVVYEPTPHETVARMLSLAEVGASDFVIDLGSGDGRIPIAAAKRGARALGIEIVPERVVEARANAQAAGVADRVTFRQENLFSTPLGEATVITLYLLPELNVRLRPKILALRPGTRVVSHRFTMGNWRPDVTEREGAWIHLWIVPARAEGNWQVRVGERLLTLSIKQEYQEVSGTAVIDGALVPLRDARLRGPEIEFALELDGARTRFRGTVAGSSMQGTIGGFGLGAPATEWRASRS
jgi:hypothetical protein